MNQVWRDKLNRLLDLLKNQLTETSTIRGVAVLITMGGGWAANLPIDSVVAVAVVIGAVLKILLPDRV